MRDEFPTVVQPTVLGPSLLMIQMKDKRRLRTQQFDIRNRKFHRKPIVPPRLANRKIRIDRYPGRIRLVKEEGVKTETGLPCWQQAARIDVDSLYHNQSVSGSRHDPLDKGGIAEQQTVRIDDPYQLCLASARLCQEFDYLRSRIRRSKIANRKIIFPKLRNFAFRIEADYIKASRDPGVDTGTLVCGSKVVAIDNTGRAGRERCEKSKPRHYLAPIFK